MGWLVLPQVLPVCKRRRDGAERRNGRVDNGHDDGLLVAAGLRASDAATDHLAVEHKRTCRASDDDRTRLRSVESGGEYSIVDQHAGYWRRAFEHADRGVTDL